jgi:predicted dehydrogenase
LISDAHARAVQQRPDAELVAFAGGTGSKARAGQFGVAHRDTLRDAAERDPIDIAVICTPTGTHAEYGVQAAALGVHVLVEKPIEKSLDAGRRLDEACRRAGVKLGRLIRCSIATYVVPFADISPAPVSALPLEPFRLQHQDFVDAARTGREPVVTGRDGLRTLALVSAVYESARLQKPVDIVGGC